MLGASLPEDGSINGCWNVVIL